MKPDKIYIQEGAILRTEKTYDNDVCYIRKDYLLEWLEQELAQRQQWFERYEDAEDLHACNELTKIINKLNEM